MSERASDGRRIIKELIEMPAYLHKCDKVRRKKKVAVLGEGHNFWYKKCPFLSFNTIKL